ncbi:MAG: FAD-binding protein [Nitrososphaerota archaeon]|nr:FAD-binding protein [Candidatus Bathyarchaeota archaeon]MDW8049136.1 FAD-binding protein [Nitrososphaerota archaeon]
MEKGTVEVLGYKIPVYSLNTVIIGSGAAGLNCADHLYANGQRDIAIVTEDIYGGTSRNTGSDKQTYYRLSLVGRTGDSPYEMAQALFSGGCMHGDIALIEATLSIQEFYHLVSLGVPFPHDEYGSYVGYKTDHDPKQRGTSAGPLTSYYMHECLLRQVRAKGIPIFDKHEAVALFRQRERVVGFLCINREEVESENFGMVLFNCTNLVLATGGPAALYKASVYPEAQRGSTGLAFEIGARGRNLTEWQYGLASVKFRWNVSGTYQQVIPRYISTDKEGHDEKEFLNEFFPSIGKLATCIFLKGYQWPFDARRILNYGSSLIDLLVYRETVKLGRRVFMDFTRNITGFKFEDLEKEAYEYLEKSDALFGTPIERLMKMNPPAVKLYADHGIDLTREPLEVAVCAQHNNGGLSGNIWWESNIKHLFPIGEVNGTHGVYRPGGSALNAGQVGGYRAAQYIAARYRDPPPKIETFLEMIRPRLEDKINLMRRLTERIDPKSRSIKEIKNEIQERMTKYAAHVRSLEGIRRALKEAYMLKENLQNRLVLSSKRELLDALEVKELTLTHIVYLEAMREYLEKGGGSRGSYIILDPNGVCPLEKLEPEWRFKPYDESLMDRICEVWLDENMSVKTEWIKVRPIPTSEGWFEKVWQEYREDRIIR